MFFPHAVSFAESDSRTLSLTFEIEPVTVVRMESDSGSANVNLGPVILGAAQESVLLVSVVSNSGGAYRVYHQLENELTNGQGDLLSESSINMSVSNGSSGGVSEMPSPVPVPRTRTPIFRSSNKGGPERFSIRYVIPGNKMIEAGQYYGNVHLEIEPS